MSSLSGSTIQSRYKSLLKIGGSANDEISASLQVIEDGDGNRAAFSISDNKILIKSNTTDQTDTLNVENIGRQGGMGRFFFCSSAAKTSFVANGTLGFTRII